MALYRIQVWHAGGNHPEALRAELSSLLLDPCSRGFSYPPLQTQWSLCACSSLCCASDAVLFAAQSPSVAETLHPAFTGVQQYAGTAFPSLPRAFLCSTSLGKWFVLCSTSLGKQFVLSPWIAAVYPTTSITPIAQSIPQPPPVLQQQQREGEDGSLRGSQGEQLSPGLGCVAAQEVSSCGSWVECSCCVVMGREGESCSFHTEVSRAELSNSGKP